MYNLGVESLHCSKILLGGWPNEPFLLTASLPSSYASHTYYVDHFLEHKALKFQWADLHARTSKLLSRFEWIKSAFNHIFLQAIIRYFFYHSFIAAWPICWRQFCRPRWNRKQKFTSKRHCTYFTWVYLYILGSRYR